MKQVTYSLKQWGRNRYNFLALILIIPAMLVFTSILLSHISRSSYVGNVARQLPITGIISSVNSYISGDFSITPEAFQQTIDDLDPNQKQGYIPVQMYFTETYLNPPSSTTPPRTPWSGFISDTMQYTDASLNVAVEPTAFIYVVGVSPSHLDQVYELFSQTNYSVTVIGDTPISTQLPNPYQETIWLNRAWYPINPKYPSRGTFSDSTIFILPEKMTQSIFENTNYSHVLVINQPTEDHFPHLINDRYHTIDQYYQTSTLYYFFWNAYILLVVIAALIIFAMMSVVMSISGFIYGKQNSDYLKYLIDRGSSSNIASKLLIYQYLFLTFIPVILTYILTVVFAKLNLMGLSPEHLESVNTVIIALIAIVTIPSGISYLFISRNLYRRIQNK